MKKNSPIWLVGSFPTISVLHFINTLCVGNPWAPPYASHAWDPYGRFGSGNSNEMTASLGAWILRKIRPCPFFWSIFTEIWEAAGVLRWMFWEELVVFFNYKFCCTSCFLWKGMLAWNGTNLCVPHLLASPKKDQTSPPSLTWPLKIYHPFQGKDSFITIIFQGLWGV